MPAITALEKITFILFINFALVSCKYAPSVNVDRGGQIILVDSISQFHEQITDYRTLSMAFYPAYFIGKQSDTFYLSAQPVSAFSSKVLEDKYRSIVNWTFPDRAKMRIYVDTQFDLVHQAISYAPVEALADRREVESIDNYKAFPVFIYNDSDSVFSVGSHNAVGHMIREAKNRQGQWVPLESPVQYYCGTNKRELVLEPQQVLIAKLLRYQGAYKTECRLKFTKWGQAIYSNLFVDFIHESHFLASPRQE